MRKQRIFDVAKRLIASERFFYAILAFLVIQAAWIALSGRYPMAYDEQNHIGVVKLYAEHFWPFWSQQPPGPAPFSSVSRDPSYLYHWLMSFPYRLFDVFWKTDEAKALAFRFVSIGMFAAGLWLYRKVLLRTGASKAIIHSVLALFILIPTVPFLAGQMNYDNLLFPLTAAMLLLTMRIVSDVKSSVLDARRLALFVSGCMLGCLIKFPFLAIAMPMAAWIVIAFARRHGLKGLRKIPGWLKLSALGLSNAWRVGLVLLVLASAGLFFERYGLNAIRYGTPIPECNQVLDEERCMAFGPWKRNYDIYQSKLNGTLDAAPHLDIYHFTYDEWLKLLLWQFFYVLNGPIDNFSVGFPMPLPYYTGVTLMTIGVILAVLYRRRIFRHQYLAGLLSVALFYIFVLWAQNYADFLRMHLATAIQARYILLVLPVILLALALGFAAALRKLPSAKVVLLAAALLIMLTQGSGAMLFIARSTPLWLWEHPLVVHANETARNILTPIMIGTEVEPPKKDY